MRRSFKDGPTMDLDYSPDEIATARTFIANPDLPMRLLRDCSQL